MYVLSIRRFLVSVVSRTLKVIGSNWDLGKWSIEWIAHCICSHRWDEQPVGVIRIFDSVRHDRSNLRGPIGSASCVMDRICVTLYGVEQRCCRQRILFWFTWIIWAPCLTLMALVDILRVSALRAGEVRLANLVSLLSGVSTFVDVFFDELLCVELGCRAMNWACPFSHTLTGSWAFCFQMLTPL